MSRRALPALLAVALFGCKPPVEAPADLNEIALYMFANYGNEGTDELAAASLNLEALLAELDLDAEKTDDRAWSLDVLTEADMGDITPTPGADIEGQVPVAVAAMFEGTMDAQVDMILDPNQVCIVAEDYVYYERRFDGDASCFEGQGCESVSMTNVARYESMLADVWLEEQMVSRWVELDDGRFAVIERGWIEQAFLSDSENATWDQRYGIDFYLPTADGDAIYRFFAFWSSADIPGIGEDSYASLAVSGIDKGFVNEQAFADGEVCDGRDGEYEPPF